MICKKMGILRSILISKTTFHSLSFVFQFLEEVVVKKKNKKNPDVDTSFLPDREREVNAFVQYLFFMLAMYSCHVCYFYPNP